MGIHIQYHLTPVKLIEILEPVFGKSTEMEGFTETEVAEAEARMKIKIPEVYREYLLKCGQCSLNWKLNWLYDPKDMELTYDRNRAYRDEDYDPDDPDWAVDEWILDLDHLEKKETTINPFGVVFQYPEEEWGRFVRNYLMIWNENQGCWEAGICVDDFEKEDMPVYYPVGRYEYQWAMAAPSIRSFLSWMIFYAIEGSESQCFSEQAEIQKYLEENEIDLEILTPNPPAFSDEHLSNFFIPDKKVVGFYSHGYTDYPDELFVFSLS